MASLADPNTGGIDKSTVVWLNKNVPLLLGHISSLQNYMYLPVRKDKESAEAYSMHSSSTAAMS